VLGSKPTTGEDIVVGYLADHDYPTADDDVLTVPDRHLEGLVLFVWWKATQELAAEQAIAAGITTMLLTQFDMLVYRAAREYRYWLKYAQSEETRRRREARRAWRDWEGLRK